MRTRPSTSKRPAKPRRRQQCAAGCGNDADPAHKLVLDEGCYCAACAMALVNFALSNPDLLAGVMS